MTTQSGRLMTSLAHAEPDLYLDQIAAQERCSYEIMQHAYRNQAAEARNQMQYTDTTSTTDRTCEAHLCGASIPAGVNHAERMIPGKPASRRVVCAACAAAGRAAEAAKVAVVAPVAAKAVRRAVARKSRSVWPQSYSLVCRCKNCVSGRESLCLRA